MVDAISAGNAQGRINTGSTMLAGNFETFLMLLTTQLKNQDPLSPVDSNEFTAQLTQMAGVEQQLLTNDLLTSILAGQQSAGLSNAALYIGKEATAVWSSVELQDGAANWSYELADNAADVRLQVLNSAGAVVWSGPAPQTGAGLHDFAWDGKTTAGGQLADGGVYTLKITATNANGAAVDSQVLVRGRVSGVELYNGQPYLTVGGSILPLASVIALEERAATTSPPPGEQDDDEQGLLASLASSLNPLKLFS